MALRWQIRERTPDCLQSRSKLSELTAHSAFAGFQNDFWVR